ncbi:MAG TPA: FAD-binding oxidoreductase [Alphaproteobacteria bacterium]|nr:FAD-binding oxidoreductase [Alphaproteobacteria bacterium]
MRPLTSPDHLSWGRWPARPQQAQHLSFTTDTLPHGPWLPIGNQRSQGDVCLNSTGTLVCTANLNRLIAFDAARGVLTAEAGITLHDILQFIVPQGWFLPVVPGTRYVTLGGAIANDVHGKNHQTNGSFGHHVVALTLRRGNGKTIAASTTQNRDWLHATIGGLGLTGLITQATIKLQRIASGYLQVETVRQKNFDHFLSLSKNSKGFEHVISWVDSTAPATEPGRGWFQRARWSATPGPLAAPGNGPLLSLPFVLPLSAINRPTVWGFNQLWNRLPRPASALTGYQKFLWPLDGIGNWNYVYGPRGFVQFQFVVPQAAAATLLPALMPVAQAAGMSFLNTLKLMGNKKPAGLLSFPRAGISMAIDLPYKGAQTLAALKRMEGMVVGAGGALYPAKDATMAPATFRHAFPQWRSMQKFIDPTITSDFWQRVNT